MPAALRQNEIEQLSLRRLEQFRERTVHAAGQADRARRQLERAQAQRAELEANPPLAASRPAGERALVLVFPLLLLGAALSEWVVSVPTAEWLTLAVLGRPEWLPVTRMLLPLGIIAADVLAAYLRFRALQEAELAEGADIRPAVGWLLLVTMTALSLATQLALRPPAGSPPQLVQTFWLRTAGLVGITAALHALLILSGSTLMESLSAWGHLLAWWRLAREEASADESRQHYSQDALAWFNRYVRSRNEHVQRFGDPGADAFDQVTREVLRSQLGYDPFTVALPAGGSAAPPAPEPPRNGGADPQPWEEETEVRA